MKEGKMVSFGFRAASSLISWEWGLLFHFILAKIPEYSCALSLVIIFFTHLFK